MLIVPGNTLLSFLMKMCSEVEFYKNEFDKMHLQFPDFLRNDKTMEDLGKECVSAMVLFYES